MRVTPERLSELQRLAEKATPGPWLYCPGEMTRSANAGRIIADKVRVANLSYRADKSIGQKEADAQLIAAARTAVPDLIADLQEARSEIERLQTVLREIIVEADGCDWTPPFLREATIRNARAALAQNERGEK